MTGEDYSAKGSCYWMATGLGAFSIVLDRPARPLIVIPGGAKVSEQTQLIRNM